MICRIEGGGRITELPCLNLGVFLPSDNDRPAALARGRLPVAAAARRLLAERKGKYEQGSEGRLCFWRMLDLVRPIHLRDAGEGSRYFIELKGLPVIGRSSALTLLASGLSEEERPTQTDGARGRKGGRGAQEGNSLVWQSAESHCESVSFSPSALSFHG